jgi:hypothetical protein
MYPVALTIGVVLFLAVGWFVLKPFRTKAGSWRAAATIQAADARRAALSALRDLDFDHQIGKISEEDYSGLRAQLVTDVARYMSPDSEQDGRIEAMIRARSSAAGKKSCPQCGKGFSGDPAFCPHCGTSLGLTCPSCGKPVISGDLFCRSCGGKLEVPAEAAG